MKKIIIVILFLSITAGLTLTNVKKDPSGSGLRIKNIEALADSEGGGFPTPCKVPGSICMSYGPEGELVFYPGLTLADD